MTTPPSSSPTDPDATDGTHATGDTTRPTTLLTVIIDRSGSMGPLHGAVIEGVNDLLASVDPATRVTIAQFDSQGPYEVIVDGIPAAEIPPLRHDQYEPRGGTPLFDAVGIGICRTAGRAREIEILDGVTPTVVLAIVTDGEENASTEYTGAAVTRLLGEYRNEGWTVTYIGLGLGDEAFTQAAAIGVAYDQVMSSSADFDGTVAAFRTISDLTRGES